MSTESYEYGITGFVKLENNVAKKYAKFDELFWLSEYSVLVHMHMYTTENIIKMIGNAYVSSVEHPIEKTNNTYWMTTMPRYKRTLCEAKIFRDSEIIQIMLDLTSALSFMHKKNIMHRDIKQNNILLDDMGRAIFIDFSHAIRNNNCPTLNTYVCTYTYRAPEVFKYKKKKVDSYDEKIDIWSIGIILFELCTGNSLFEMTDYMTEEKAEIFFTGEYMSVIQDLFNKKKKAFFHVQKYWSWIVKMLAFDPNERISAADLHTEIYKFAVCKSINFITPVNGHLDLHQFYSELSCKRNTNDNTISDKNKALLCGCMDIVNKIQNKIQNNIITDYYSNRLKYFVEKNAINNDNIVHFVIALFIIIERVIYDRDTYVNRYAKKLGVDINKIRNMIVYIIATFSKELFLYDGFFGDNCTNSVMSTIYPNDTIYTNAINTRDQDKKSDQTNEIITTTNKRNLNATNKVYALELDDEIKQLSIKKTNTTSKQAFKQLTIDKHTELKCDAVSKFDDSLNACLDKKTNTCRTRSKSDTYRYRRSDRLKNLYKTAKSYNRFNNQHLPLSAE